MGNLGTFGKGISAFIQRGPFNLKIHTTLFWILYITMNHDQESNAAIELQTPVIMPPSPLLTMAVTATTASIATTAASYFILRHWYRYRIFDSNLFRFLEHKV
jgi:predicted secreted protein